MTLHFDIAVVGAGHAGIEAALAAARLGCKTLCFCTNLDAVGNLPCNPSIGGTAKGHLVREIDALGGEMALAADACCIQYRMLNRGKGPAVHSLRGQADRVRYREYMKSALERQENLWLRQGEIVDIHTHDGHVSAVVTELGMRYPVKAVILATGTFLGGRIIIGSHSFEAGPDGLMSARPLGDCLRRLSLPLRRFKTGTPPRVLGRSINTALMTVQPGEDTIPFSFETRQQPKNQVVCHQSWTTGETHRILRENLHRSPLFSGDIQGVGPRYCPSIEDKVVRFADKSRHPVFCEPMGLHTDEVYLQGLSSSMPEDVQWQVLQSVPGLEQAQITRPAYAIEYDCIDPLSLDSSMAVKSIPGLYGAGQFCGSSGYEEAAAQGLVAGINAARWVQGKPEVIFPRSESYIGTLIDDLVTRGTDEPYRMMTSRSEYRLLLRQDNADARLTALGYDIGLISEERHRRTQDKLVQVSQTIKELESLSLPPSEALRALLENAGSSVPVSGVRLSELLRRPELNLVMLAPLYPPILELSPQVREQAEIQIKYEGYIRRQNAAVQAFGRMERVRLPHDLDYEQCKGLRIEARQKLGRVRPANLGQASRISGVSPADVTVLMLYMEARGRRASSEDA